MSSENRRLCIAWAACAALIGCLGVGGRASSSPMVNVAAEAIQVAENTVPRRASSTVVEAVPEVVPTTVPTTTVVPVPPPTAPAPLTTRPPEAAPAPTTPSSPRPPSATPAAPPVPAASPGDPQSYAQALLHEMVPARWLAVVPARISVIGGSTSWSHDDGTMDMALGHLADPDLARFTIAHEWAHLAAWKFGTNAYSGAPPAGFPYDGAMPEEMWADCIGIALSGVHQRSHGLPRCPGGALSFAGAWITAGPPGR
ncbi:MAG: hypothetical protein Q8K58_16230 [Acidimicrobiales bacterium]|nr:hypothetical protein [Acidimicrobiales bacterium]